METCKRLQKSCAILLYFSLYFLYFGGNQKRENASFLLVSVSRARFAFFGETGLWRKTTFSPGEIFTQSTEITSLKSSYLTDLTLLDKLFLSLGSLLKRTTEKYLFTIIYPVFYLPEESMDPKALSTKTSRISCLGLSDFSIISN